MIKKIMQLACVLRAQEPKAQSPEPRVFSKDGRVCRPATAVGMEHPEFKAQSPEPGVFPKGGRAWGNCSLLIAHCSLNSAACDCICHDGFSSNDSAGVQEPRSGRRVGGTPLLRFANRLMRGRRFTHFAPDATKRVPPMPVFHSARLLGSRALGLLGLFLFSLIALPISSIAAQPQWRIPKYTLQARQLPVRDALEAFGIAQGISVVMSDAVTGGFSGDFIDKPSTDFLNDIAAMHSLTWYYDGSAIYVYGASEISSAMIDLQFMNVDEVKKTMTELGVEDERFPIHTARDGELILVSGPPRYVALVLQTIEKADNLRKMRTFNEVETRIFRLKNTWADDVSFSGGDSSFPGVATILNDIMAIGDGGRDTSMTNDTEEVFGVLSSGLRPIIRADQRLNAVVVRDSIVRMPMYEKLIAELDVPQPLVEIAITTIEMTRENSLDWQSSIRLTGSQDDISYGVGQNAGNLSGVPDISGQGLAGALSYIGNRFNIDASLTALKKKGKLRSLSRSSILTLNNLSAEMTDEQSYHTKVVGSEVATLSKVSAGTSLGVKPRIIFAPEGSTNVPNCVWLTLKLTDGGFEAASVDSLPMTRQTSLTTQAAVVEDESILLAGYFRTVEDDVAWGIPFLRDIPLIGWLFGGTSREKQEVQRLFVFTPHIVDWSNYAVSNTNRVSESMTRLRDRDLLKQAKKEVEADQAREDEEKRIEEAEERAREEKRFNRQLAREPESPRAQEAETELKAQEPESPRVQAAEIKTEAGKKTDKEEGKK